MRTLSIVWLFIVGIWIIPNQQHVEAGILRAALNRLNMTIHDNLLKLFPPEKRAAFIEHSAHLYKCYDNKIGRKKLDIFRQKLRKIVIIYFRKFPKFLTFLKRRRERVERIISFIKSMLDMGNEILECMTNTSKGKKPTLYGLTSLSALSHEEFKETILMDPAIFLSGFNKDEDLRKPFITLQENDDKVVANPMLDDFANYPRVDYLNPVKCFPNKSKSYHVEKPKEFNWQDRGILSEVGMQRCGSCWLFSTRDMLETYYRLFNNITLDSNYFHKDDIRVSEQDVLDCSIDGCHGGFPGRALNWFHHFGAPVSSTNPYIGKWTRERQCKAHMPIFKVPGFCAYVALSEDDTLENSLQTLLMDKGPLVVAIDASKIKNLRGPFNGEMDHRISHAIMLVGWNKDYWILKNSWGNDHGIDGYLYLNKDARSGIELMINFITPN